MTKNNYLTEQVESLANDPLVLSFILLIPCIFMTAFGLYNFYAGEHPLAYLTFILDALMFSSLVILIVTGKTAVPRYLCAFTLVLGFYSYLFHGGVEGSALIGCQIFIPGVILILGFDKSLFLMIAILLSLVVVFSGIIDDVYPLPYTETLQWRFFFVLLGNIVFMMGIEYSRRNGYQKLLIMNETVDRAVNYDQLTSLTNRREMIDTLEQSWQRHVSDGEQYSLLLGGVDRFKKFNNKYGYKFGDQLLVELGTAMQAALKNKGTVARWSSDEFLILLPGMNSKAASKVAEKMRAVVADLYCGPREGNMRATISFGVCAFDRGGSKDELITMADEGLYQAKQMGRDIAVVV